MLLDTEVGEVRGDILGVELTTVITAEHAQLVPGLALHACLKPANSMCGLVLALQ
jgi:hypothetical protein